MKRPENVLQQYSQFGVIITFILHSVIIFFDQTLIQSFFSPSHFYIIICNQIFRPPVRQTSVDI